MTVGRVYAQQVASPQATTIGQSGDAVLDFAYDSATGDLRILFDFDPRIVIDPDVSKTHPLQVIRLNSSTGLFLPGGFNGSVFTAGTDVNASLIFGAVSRADGVPDGYDLGDVLPAGMSLSTLAGDLTLQWNVFGGGLHLKVGDLVAGFFGGGGNVEHYIGSIGNWSDGANWSLARAPVAGDVVVIAPSGGANVVVTFDAAAPAATGLASLMIDATTAATASLSQSLGVLGVFNNVTVGDVGSGAFSQDGGTHHVGRTLVLGAAQGSAGTYDLSGTASLTAADETIADRGAGVFNQTGGTNVVSGGIRVGFGSSGVGSYNLFGGNAQAATVAVGVSGTGVLAVGSGGSLQVSGGISVGTSSASAIHLAGGFVSAGTVFLPDWSRLDLGAGSFSIAGGSLAAPGTLTIGAGGASNAASFSQGGGSYRALALLVGSPDGAAGTFNLAGNGSFTVTGPATIANAASSIVLSGGTFTAGTLDFGGDPTRLHWTAGTLRITGTNGAIIGSAGGSPSDVVWPASLALAAGQSLSLPAAPLRITDGGTLHLAGGAVAATSLDVSGSGQLDWTAGTIAISRLALGAGQGGPFGGPALDVGAGKSLSADSATIGASAALSVSGGSFLAGSLDNAGALSVAGGGTASATALNNSGNVTLGGGSLTTSSFTNAGSFAISGGAASVGAFAGSGAVNITGGTFSATSLSTTDWTRINLAAGTLNVSGGSTAASGPLAIGSGGAGNAASFNQNGGSYHASALLVGSPDGAAGSFTLAGSASIFAVAGVATVANAASSIALSGGTFTASALDLGGDPTRLHWTGGTLQLTGTNGAAIGEFPAPVDVALPSPLTLGPAQSLALPAAPLHIGNGGTLNLTGGSISATSLDLTGSGQLNWNAGTIAIQNLALGAAQGGSFGPALDISPGRSLIASNGASIGPGAALGVSGGNLTTGAFVNAGSVTVSAGNAVTGDFVNTGSLTVNGGTAAANALSGTGSVAISGTGRFVLRRGLGPRPANAIPAVQITASAVLDLGDQPLVVDTAALPDPVVRQYLRSAYDADATGIGDWKGTGGITSADAIVSHAGGTNATLKVSVGYVNGATATDPLFAGQSVVAGLATNRTLIRPTLNGDLNLDGKVDENDLFLFSGLGQYAKPATPYGWVSGDLNHDGRVDATDVSIFHRAANLNNGAYPAASASPTVVSRLAAPSSSTVGTHGDGALDFDYNSLTGDVKINYDADPRISAAQPLQSIRLISASGMLRPNLFQPTAFTLGSGASTTKLTGTAAGLDSVGDGYDLGRVLPSGLNPALIAADLTAEWNVYGGGLALKAGDMAAVTLPTGGFGHTGDGQLDFLYDPTTGDLKVRYDGDSAISAAHPLQVIRLSSASGLFDPDRFNETGFSNVTADAFHLNGTILGAGSLPDGYDFGDVLPTGVDIRQLAGDLTLQWNVFGGGIQLRTGYLIAPEPEPHVLALGAVALMSLSARPRRRRPATS